LLFISSSTPINREDKKPSLLYLTDSDLNVSKEDINYTLIKSKNNENAANEIRARVAALAWVLKKFN
jgi:hypothetical protein